MMQKIDSKIQPNLKQSPYGHSGDKEIQCVSKNNFKQMLLRLDSKCTEIVELENQYFQTIVCISREYAKDFTCLSRRVFCILALQHVSLDEVDRGLVISLTNIGGKLIKNGAFVLGLCRYIYNYTEHPSKAKFIAEKLHKQLASDRAFYDFESKEIFSSFKQQESSNLIIQADSVEPSRTSMVYPVVPSIFNSSQNRTVLDAVEEQPQGGDLSAPAIQYPAGNKWSKSDDIFLLECCVQFPTLTTAYAEVAKVFGKTQRSCSRRRERLLQHAFKLGLKGNNSQLQINLLNYMKNIKKDIPRIRTREFRRNHQIAPARQQEEISSVSARSVPDQNIGQVKFESEGSFYKPI